MSSGPSRGRAGLLVWEVPCVSACVGSAWGGGGGWWTMRCYDQREKWTDVTCAHVISISSSISISSISTEQNEERQRTARERRPDGRTYVVVPGHVKGGGDDGDAGEGDESERERGGEGGEGTRSEAEHGCRCRCRCNGECLTRHEDERTRTRRGVCSPRAVQVAGMPESFIAYSVQRGQDRTGERIG